MDVEPAVGQPVKSAARTVELLEHLAAAGRKLSLPELHQQLKYPKSSLHVLLQTLRQLGWVETDHTGRYFGLGLRALLVGTSYLDGDEILAAARDAMDWLAEETGETIHLARLDGPDVVYLATRESKHYLRSFSRVGRRLPAYVTSLGKAILAERDDAFALIGDNLAPLTDNTLTTRESLGRELLATRARGYGVDREENTVGLRCYGVALYIHRPVAHALSCSVPVARLDAQRELMIVDALRKARFDIERRALGIAR